MNWGAVKAASRDARSAAGGGGRAGGPGAGAAGLGSGIDYPGLVAGLRGQYGALPQGAPVRLAKRTSNLFRFRAPTSSPGLDVSGLDGVLAVDRRARTADVLGMTTYEHLVEATLAADLMPLVVPQLKTITIGGAVTGLGIEASSFRNGLPHESVLDMDVMTGDGEVRTVRPGDELFDAFPNSYGTLGYALRLRIALEPVQPFVHLEHRRHSTVGDLVADVVEQCGRADADFVDGTVFGADELYLTVGRFVAGAPYASDYTGSQIYYRSLQQRSEDYLSVADFLWRWDTDWFWCSRAFGVQQPLVRAVWPRRFKRSDVYWKLVALENRYGVKRRIDRWRGLPEQEAVVQDVELPIDRTAEFLEFFLREVPITPFWICPLRARRRWPLYDLDPARLYVNVGFWSTVPLAPGQPGGASNRRVERVVSDLGGRKSLYSTSYYDEAEFWRLYNGEHYRRLKRAYDPDARLLNLYDKCVKGR